MQQVQSSAWARGGLATGALIVIKAIIDWANLTAARDPLGFACGLAFVSSCFAYAAGYWISEWSQSLKRVDRD